MPHCQVVVVRPAGHPCHDNDVGSRAERAGAVYVVRPRIEYSPAVVGVRMQQALSKKEATSTKKTPAISSRHVSSAASDMQSAKTTSKNEGCELLASNCIHCLHQQLLVYSNCPCLKGQALRVHSRIARKGTFFAGSKVPATIFVKSLGKTTGISPFKVTNHLKTVLLQLFRAPSLIVQN